MHWKGFLQEECIATNFYKNNVLKIIYKGNVREWIMLQELIVGEFYRRMEVTFTREMHSK